MRDPLSAAEMAALHARAFTVPRPWRESEIRDLLASPHCLALAEPRGFAIVRIVADEAELLTLAVAPEARRQGIGARLLARVIASARQRHAGTLLLEVAADNAGALALYRRAGLAQVARRPGYYRQPDGTAVDALILSLDLRPT